MGIGKETTTDGSVIDYVIGSTFVLSKTTDFLYMILMGYSQTSIVL